MNRNFRNNYAWEICSNPIEKEKNIYYEKTVNILLTRRSSYGDQIFAHENDDWTNKARHILIGQFCSYLNRDGGSDSEVFLTVTLTSFVLLEVTILNSIAIQTTNDIASFTLITISIKNPRPHNQLYAKNAKKWIYFFQSLQFCYWYSSSEAMRCDVKVAIRRLPAKLSMK